MDVRRKTEKGMEENKRGEKESSERKILKTEKEKEKREMRKRER